MGFNLAQNTYFSKQGSRKINQVHYRNCELVSEFSNILFSNEMSVGTEVLFL